MKKARETIRELYIPSGEEGVAGEVRLATQENVALGMGISKSTYANYESGITVLTERAAERFCVALDVCPIWLATGLAYMQSNTTDFFPKTKMARKPFTQTAKEYFAPGSVGELTAFNLLIGAAQVSCSDVGKAIEQLRAIGIENQEGKDALFHAEVHQRRLREHLNKSHRILVVERKWQMQKQGNDLPKK